MVFSLLPVPKTHAAYDSGYSGGKNGDNNGIMAHGIDISTWQGHEVDFQKIREQGYSFVILRAGFARTKDDTFEENYTRAKAAGLNVGVYLYSYAHDGGDAYEEAQALKGWLAGKQLEYPVYFDLEDPEIHEPMGKEELTGIALSFLDAMAAEGWLVGLYSSRSWLSSKIDTDRVCAKYECWLAQYWNTGSYDTYGDYDGICGMWQYSSSGKVEGVPGNVDMNVAFKDYPSICKHYGFNGYSALGSTMTLNGTSLPAVLPLGSTMNPGGVISSSQGDISDVTISIRDENGEIVKSHSVAPNVKQYDISALANGLKPEELGEGKYSYTITATNEAETLTLLRQTMFIGKNGIYLNSISVPRDLKAGESFQAEGKLTAAEKMCRVTVAVSSGDQIVIKAEAAPDSTIFDIKMLSSELKLESLTPGEYEYSVTVDMDRGTFTVLKEAFSVWVKDDPMTLSNLTLKTDYFPGDEVRITGTVTSARSDIRSLTVEILNLNREAVASMDLPAPVKSLEIGDLTGKLELENLDYGVYTLVIRGLNDGGPATIAEQNFFIRPDAISLCGCNAPILLTKGETFRLEGVIASDASPLEFVSVNVVDVNGKVHLSAGAVPGRNVFDLSSLNHRLSFSGLMENDYTLYINAKNGHTFTTVYESTLTVADYQDQIRWDGVHFDPAGLSYSQGSGLGLWGTVTSEASELQNITATLFSETSLMTVSTATISPGARSASVAGLGQRLRFSALTEGEYRLVITGENASGSTLLMNSTLTVSSCSHSRLASGATYSPLCNSAGAVCDTRCINCGGRVYCGKLLERIDHSYQNGICTMCQRAEFLSVHVMQTGEALKQDSRIVIVGETAEGWIALGPDGSARRIDAPNAKGELILSAELLWTPERQRDGTYAFRNVYGELLHLDRNGVHIGPGKANACLTLENNNSISQIYKDGLWLAASEGKFDLSAEKSTLRLFAFTN